LDHASGGLEDLGAYRRLVGGELLAYGRELVFVWRLADCVNVLVSGYGLLLAALPNTVAGCWDYVV